MKIFIAGDSTAAIKEESKRPETGWGEKLNNFLLPGVEIVNAAINGRSTKSFLFENRLKEIEKSFKHGDCLLIQFGHNDSKIEDPYRYANPEGEYQKNLKIFIDTAKNKGVTPVILTSVSRRKFLEDKNTIDPLAVGVYPAIASNFAEMEGFVCLDIFSLSKSLYEFLGYEKSKKLFLKFKPNEHINYPAGIDDNTHFNDFGAYVIASLIAESVLVSSLELRNYVDESKILSFKEIKKRT